MQLCDHKPDPGCQKCRNNLNFEPPKHLLDEIAAGNAVIFAGAGVSTESKTVWPHTFYDEILAETDSATDRSLSFPAVMSRFCERPNGRTILMQRLHRRVQNIASFPELYESATAFHRELSTLYPISTIFTTNWDTFFEQECGATPFVTAQDYALADAAERKVYKLHGSINNLGSVVITEDDYAQSKRRLQSGVLGSTLVHTLATKTVVFVGYSFRDHDFQSIWRLVKRQLGRHARYCYVVTLDAECAGFFKSNRVSMICTDCTYFVKVVKQHLVANRMLIDDSVFDDISVLLDRAEHVHDKLHERVSYQRHPETVHCASYQDGLIHAFERISSQAKTGQYSNPVRVSQTANAYEDFRRQFVRERRYSDAAYVEGYQNGLICLLVNRDERLKVPMSFLHGLKGDVRSFSAYKRLRKDASFLHRAAYKEAIKLARIYAGSSKNLTVHHIPRL